MIVRPCFVSRSDQSRSTQLIIRNRDEADGWCFNGLSMVNSDLTIDLLISSLEAAHTGWFSSSIRLLEKHVSVVAV